MGRSTFGSWCIEFLMSKSDIEVKAVSAAYFALKKQGYVSAIDVFMGMGILSKEDHDSWRFGRVPYLEKVVQSNLSKISQVMKSFRIWSAEQELKPSETVYRKWGKGSKHDLRFSKTGNPKIEKAYRTHYVSPKLGDKKIELSSTSKSA